MVSTSTRHPQVNINTLCALGTSGVSLNSMAQRTLGSVGTTVSTASLVLLQYALLIACMCFIMRHSLSI